MDLLKLKPTQILRLAVLILSLTILGVIANLVLQRSHVDHLTLAAGSQTGESYILSTALKTVVERHHPHIKINLLETGGTVESLKLMDSGTAHLAAAQADILTGPSARPVAVLYDDTFQLLTRRNSDIETFADLAHQTIALPSSGGQFQSFVRVASHFSLLPSDFHFIGTNDTAADQAFADGHADALFRVRALGNPAIQRLVTTNQFRVVQIDHAAAMKIKNPAFQPAVVPAGTYLGHPAIPAQDLPSIAVHRTLLASATVSDQAIRAITETLLERRHEIAHEIPDQAAEVRLLLAQVRRPDNQANLGPALHPGALQHYEKDKPSFILAHADYLGLLLTVVVMVSSWAWEVRAWLERKQKSVADNYSNRVVALMNQARQSHTHASLDAIRDQLLAILVEAVSDLDNDKLSADSFHSFRAILQIGLEVVRDRWASLDVAVHSIAHHA